MVSEVPDYRRQIHRQVEDGCTNKTPKRWGVGGGESLLCFTLLTRKIQMV